MALLCPSGASGRAPSSGWRRAQGSGALATAGDGVAVDGVAGEGRTFAARAGVGAMGQGALNGVLFRRVSLNASTTLHRQVIPVADWPEPHWGALEIRTLNTGRVTIDALGVSAA